MKHYERHYWALRIEMKEAEEQEEWTRYEELKSEYLQLCAVMLEQLMEEHSDVLKRLKEI